MEQKTPNPKCTTCKCYWKPDDTDIKTSGLFFKTCKKCREYDKKQRTEKYTCEHGKRRSRCKDCGGASICEHGRQRSVCKDCGGSSFCEHGKIKSVCKECGGGSICEHGKIRSVCKECGGKSICEHGRIKSQCKECGGSQICEHGKVKNFCKECGGSTFCEHGKYKHRCRECNLKLYLVYLQRKHLRKLFNKTDVVKKTKPSIEYLGCSSEYFIEYIEKQFKEGMNWDNIHLDHIKPVSKFNLDDEDEFLQCCNYKNFQPLLAKDNLEKHNKFTKEDEEEWIKRMEDLTI
jgi:hypothetical protein